MEKKKEQRTPNKIRVNLCNTTVQMNRDHLTIKILHKQQRRNYLSNFKVLKSFFILFNVLSYKFKGSQPHLQC